MDQISLTELRRFYFGPTLTESILYGYDCLREFFGWNGSAKNKTAEPLDSSGLQRIESKEALDKLIAEPKIKTEPEDLDDKFDSTVSGSFSKELVVASMSSESRSTHHSKGHSNDSNITEIITDNKIGQSSKKSTNPEVAPETKRKRSSNDIRKSSSIIVEGLKSANKTAPMIADHYSAEQNYGRSSNLSARNDIFPVKFSRELQKTLSGLRKKSDIMVKGSDPAKINSQLKSEATTTSMQSGKRVSSNEFVLSGERKRSSKQLRNLSSTSLAKDLTSQNSKFKSCLSGSERRMSLTGATPRRPATSSTSEPKNRSLSAASPRRHSSSSHRHSSSLRDPEVPSATTHQSRHQPRLTVTRWAIAHINEFDDGAITYEILPDAPKLLPVVGALGQNPFDVLRQMQKLQKLQPIPELASTEVIFATLPGGHTVSYKSDAAKSL